MYPVQCTGCHAAFPFMYFKLLYVLQQLNAEWMLIVQERLRKSHSTCIISNPNLYIMHISASCIQHVSPKHENTFTAQELWDRGTKPYTLYKPGREIKSTSRIELFGPPDKNSRETQTDTSDSCELMNKITPGRCFLIDRYLMQWHSHILFGSAVHWVKLSGE